MESCFSALAVFLVGLVVLQLASTAPTVFIDNSSSIKSSVNVPAKGKEALEPILGKRFRLDHCDNMEETLKAAGGNENTINLASRLTFTLMLTENNGEYTLTSDVYMKIGNMLIKVRTSSVPFHIGQETQVVNVRGEIVQAVITQVGNTLTETRNCDCGTTVRIFTPEEVRTIEKIKDATNTCIFKPE